MLVQPILASFRDSTGAGTGLYRVDSKNIIRNQIERVPTSKLYLVILDPRHTHNGRACHRQAGLAAQARCANRPPLTRHRPRHRFPSPSFSGPSRTHRTASTLLCPLEVDGVVRACVRACVRVVLNGPPDTPCLHRQLAHAAPWSRPGGMSAATVSNNRLGVEPPVPAPPPSSPSRPCPSEITTTAISQHAVPQRRPVRGGAMTVRDWEE